MLEVEVHRAGQSVGDDKRRRCQVVHLDIRADAPFEVAVAREHGGDGEVVRIDRLGDLGQQRARIAYAGGAAESHQFVAETIEVVLQPGLFQVVGHHLGTGGQRGLHPWLGLEAFGDRITGDEAGGDHDRGIRCVRARGD